MLLTECSERPAALGALTSLTTRPEITFMNISAWGSDRYPSAAAWLVLAVAVPSPYDHFLNTVTLEEVE